MNYEITGHTGFTALLGHPVTHSISPQMHNEAFRQLGIDLVYLAFDVDPMHIREAFEGLKAVHIQGFNLTMPLKTAIIPFLDGLTPAAQLAGSVNTVFLQEDRYIGHTTDGVGYMRSVADAGYHILGKKMTLLGAGGAATAICVQAALDGVSSIDMFKRKNASFTKTEEFCQRVSDHTGCPIRLLDIEDHELLADSIQNSAILTNATDVGMAPKTEHSILPDSFFLPAHLIVSDIIYNPRETLLMRQAKEAGCPAFNGLYMLLFQGAEAFRCWTGQEMPIDLIKQKYFTNERK